MSTFFYFFCFLFFRLFGSFGFRSDEEAGSVCRSLQPLRRQERRAEGTPEAGGGPPSYIIRAHQAKRHEVNSILNFVFVLCLFILNSMVLACVAAVIYEIFKYFYTPFLFFSR